jgi:hypothetical protein
MYFGLQHKDITSLGLRTVISLPTSDGLVVHCLEKPPFVFPPIVNSGGNIPTVEDWKLLWRAWDFVTLQMIPEGMLHRKPIDLRHKCLFYIGHIPVFLDMMISKVCGGTRTDPVWFGEIFEVRARLTPSKH